MKTTVEISDALLREAKKVAAEEGSSLRALVEEGLRKALGDRRKRGGFRLRKASFGGEGLQEGLRWDEMGEAAYEGRGG